MFGEHYIQLFTSHKGLQVISSKHIYSGLHKIKGIQPLIKAQKYVNYSIDKEKFYQQGKKYVEFKMNIYN